MKLSIDIWYDAALNFSTDEFSSLLGTLPITSTRKTAVNLASGSNLDNRIYALQLVSKDYSASNDTELAIGLALLGLKLCKHGFEADGTSVSNTYLAGISQFAIEAHRVFSRQGQYQQQEGVIQETLDWLLARNVHDRHLIDLRLAKIESLITFGFLEEAQQQLEYEQTLGNQNHSQFLLLESKLESKLVSVAQIKEAQANTQKPAKKSKGDLNKIVSSLNSLEPRFGNLFVKLGKRFNKVSRKLSSRQSVNHHNQTHSSLADLLGNTANDNQQQLQLSSIIQKGLAVIADPSKGQSVTALIELKQTLEAARKQAYSLQLEDTVIETLWPLYVCYKRLNYSENALATLQDIRQWVNKRRLLISDPHKRADVSNLYPLLYKELAAMLIEQQNHQELLDVIEESKAQTLADKWAIQTSADCYQNKMQKTSDWLPERMQSLQANYLTYLVDEDVSYAVCVSKNGEIISATIPVGQQQLALYRKRLTFPKPITKTDLENSLSAEEDKLSLFASWLEQAYFEDRLSKDDHICYSPDGLLSSVPLQSLTFNRQPLILTFTCSRIYCADDLTSYQSNQCHRPARFIAVNESDQVSNAHKFLHQTESAVTDWLETSVIEGEALKSTRLDNDFFQTRILTNALVHLSTQLCNPVSILSNLVINSINAPTLKDSHITIQSPPSANAGDDTSCDSLSLEWFLLLKQAASVLIVNSNVTPEVSAQFCICFYQHWMIDGKTRAQAWRAAVFELMASKNNNLSDQGHQWVAFNLAGDWR